MLTDTQFKSGKFWTRGPMVVTGCTKVSPGCKNCWSEKAHVMRSQGPNAHVWPPDCLTDGRFNGKVRFNLDALRKAVKGKKPQVIAIWNDLYHEGVTDLEIKMAWAVMMAAKHHTFLIVTKRIERIALACIGKVGLMPFPPHIIHIATMEDQKRVDKRMGDLLRIPGKRGIIIEPMLGPVDLDLWAFTHPTLTASESPNVGYRKGMINQVILGPENGSGKRPFNEEWAESVRAQCAGAGVPFYRKDRGEGSLIWR